MLDPAIKVIPAGYDNFWITKRDCLISKFNTKGLTSDNSYCVDFNLKCSALSFNTQTVLPGERATSK